MSLKVSYAAACGGLAGGLVGLAVCVVQGVGWNESVFRVFVLAVSAAWMGMLLAWLNVMLSPQNEDSNDGESTP
ncbi:MAG: hypothetical protein COA61_008235 [Zetaproteobacteria bacterium]|nr:hypothetical protein [Zetaproteobacteria bacterium]